MLHAFVRACCEGTESKITVALLLAIELREVVMSSDNMNIQDRRQEMAPQNEMSEHSLGAQFQNDTAAQFASAIPKNNGSMRSNAPSQATASSIDIGSSSELDIPEGTFDDGGRKERAALTPEEEAARKERKRLKKEKKKKKDPEAKRKKKEKKAKKEKRRHDKARISGESASSGEPKDLVRDQREHHRHSSSEPIIQEEVKNAWRTESGTTANTEPVSLTPGSSSSPLIERRQSLSAIMKEQEAEQLAEKAKQEENLNSMDAKELEALGPKLPGETDEERLVRHAMEMSLNDFKLSSSSNSSPRARNKIARSTSVPPQRPPPPDYDNSTIDDISLRDGDSLATMDVTEVVIEDPRGNMQSERRMSTRNILPPQYSRSGSKSKPSHPRASLKKDNDDPKANLYDDDPKAQFDVDDPLTHWDQDDAKKKFFNARLDGDLYSEVPRRPAFRTNRSSASNDSHGRRSSTASESRPVAAIEPMDQIRLARQNLSAQEAEEIERALREAGEDSVGGTQSSSRQSSTTSRRQSAPNLPSPNTEPRPTVLDEQMAASLPNVASDHLSPDEAAEIAKALQEADEAEARESFQLALQLQSQEATLFTAQRAMRSRQQAAQGNVRVVPRDPPAASEDSIIAAQAAQVGAVRSYSPPVTRHPLDDSVNDLDLEEPGYRINSSRPSRNWTRVRDHVVGPNNEVRTKHDAELQAQSNARRMGLDDDDEGFIGNTAFNSFKQSMQRQTVKGVAAHGTGRANSETDKTKSGAMDPRVRMLITRAINNRLIEKCNGIVREGKEAVIYHADEGAEGGGYDVAIKVFKRIQEFKGRGAYVEGDARYEDGKFKNANSREQLEMWAEKEYRNLLRANRSGVPVPTPLIQKENVVFMRFLGEDGWAVPQLKDLNIRKGSDKWTTLYSQIMVAVRR